MGLASSLPICTALGMLAVSGLAGAQATSTNAIGLWRSDDFSKTTGVNITSAAAPGFHIWQILPPDVLTYFRGQNQGAVRQLDFRGLEFFVTVPANGINKQHTIPRIEIRRGVPQSAPNEGRWLADLTPAGLFVQFGLVNFGTPTIAATYPISYILPFAVAVPVGAPTSVGVPAGNPAGDALVVRVVNYQSQYGSSGGSLLFRVTTHESPFLASMGPLSGVTFANTTGAPTEAWMDQVLLGSNPALTHEWTFTFLFDQSLIAPIKNAKQLKQGDPFPIGGLLPAQLDPANGGFAIQCDDGRGALNPQPGDVISWMVNSNVQTKLGPANAGNVWVVPFSQFEGDTLPTDPTPENWIGTGGVAQFSYIHPMALQQFLNDFEALFTGNPTPILGGALNPNNSTLGLWLGVDLANSFLNLSVLANAFNLADVSGGPQFAGPEIKMFDSTAQPLGVMIRNPALFGTRTAELKSLTIPQTGFTPVVGAMTAPNIGIDYPVLSPNPLSGKSFSVTCWVLDLSSPTNPFGFNIIDMSTILRFTL